MASSISVEESIQIERSPEEVWKAIADYSFDLEWRNGLVEMTPDPPGGPAIGTKVHEVLKQSGRDYVADTVVTDLEPGASYRFSGEGTIGGLRGARFVRPAADGGAEFTYAVELEPKGGMKLLRPILRPMVRSGLKKDLATLKELMESTPAGQ